MNSILEERLPWCKKCGARSTLVAFDEARRTRLIQAECGRLGSVRPMSRIEAVRRRVAWKPKLYAVKWTGECSNA